MCVQAECVCVHAECVCVQTECVCVCFTQQLRQKQYKLNVSVVSHWGVVACSVVSHRGVVACSPDTVARPGMGTLVGRQRRVSRGDQRSNKP